MNRDYNYIKLFVDFEDIGDFLRIHTHIDGRKTIGNDLQNLRIRYTTETNKNLLKEPTEIILNINYFNILREYYKPIQTI